MRSTTRRVAAGATLALAIAGAGAGVAWAAHPGRDGASMGAASADMPSHRGMGSQVDYRFAVHMIAHHEDAVAMAELAPGRSEDPEILALAERIARTQSEEIVRLQAAAERLEPDAGAMGGMGGMGGGMRGMGPEMGGGTDLAALEGDAFDRAFLEQMIVHHRMGVHMAAMEVRAGSDPEVRDMAQVMVDVQTSEIALMQGWLDD